ncbi:hypothetical protein HY989_00805 [Candidatus Micrarchaeota archaeon]|nr:hypothetical protein [Candidatus Micrarchaeota archaeon]
MALTELNPNSFKVQYSNARKDARSQILKVLSKEWPLSAKEIHARIKESNSLDISYQGIHKSILQLISDEVLIKNNSKYTISQNWIDDLRKFGEELKSAMNGRRHVHLDEIPDKSSVQLVFDSLMDYFYWLIDELYSNSKKNDFSDSSYINSIHALPAIGLSKSQFEHVKMLCSNSENFISVNAQTKLDRALLEIWKNLGFSAKVGSKSIPNSDTVVFRDFVVQFFIPSKTKKQLSKIYFKYKANNSAISELYSLLYENPDSLNVLVTRNADLSNEIKSQFESEFGKTK